MIAKPYQHKADRSDRRLQAGAAAERRVAYHLQCCFEDHPEVHVLHDLRIENPEQPQPGGSPGELRFDHLVVHRRGIFLIESWSVAGEVTIRSDGSGGHKWVRLYGGGETEMPCPIERAETQAEFLRGFLECRRQELVGRLPFGSRTLAKIADGTDRVGFRHAPLQLVFAVSDYGIIEKIDGRKRRGQAFPPIVGKADTIPDKVCREIDRHRKGSGILCVGRGRTHGGWRMAPGDAAGLAGFLATLDADDPTEPQAGEAACRHCDGRKLVAGSGEYGYFWFCDSCGKNTLMPMVCSACGAKGRRDAKVRIRNGRDAYLRDCRESGFSETVWTVA